MEPTPGGLVQLRWLNVKEPGQEIVAKGTKTVFDPPHLVEYNTDIHGRASVRVARGWTVHYPRWQQLHDRYKIARG